MKKTLLSFVLISLLIAGCSSTASGISPVAQTAVADSIQRQLQGTLTAVVIARTPTITLTPSETPTPTFTPSPSPTPTPTITPTWISYKPGKIIAPILLYHHVRDVENPGRYDISLQTFQTQMQYLKEWGYTSIPISTLVDVLTSGGQLPEKPVVITFDDGNLDIYQNALPIMKSLGLVGTMYVVSSRLGAKDCLSVDQLKDMLANGWEIGSHSRTHIDLVQNAGSLGSEGKGSKDYLQEQLGVKINTFSYPFGAMETFTANKIGSYGYTGAVGLGVGYIQYPGMVYYLTRMEVRHDIDLNGFAKLLPWSPISTPMPLN